MPNLLACCGCPRGSLQIQEKDGFSGDIYIYFFLGVPYIPLVRYVVLHASVVFSGAEAAL